MQQSSTLKVVKVLLPNEVPTSLKTSDTRTRSQNEILRPMLQSDEHDCH